MTDVITAQWRLLTLRFREADVAALGRRHLIFGLGVTWLVGVGRWWDDPEAHLLQHLGLGSVAYFFVIAAVLWLALWPLRPRAAS